MKKDIKLYVPLDPNDFIYVIIYKKREFGLFEEGWVLLSDNSSVLDDQYKNHYKKADKIDLILYSDLIKLFNRFYKKWKNLQEEPNLKIP